MIEPSDYSAEPGADVKPDNGETLDYLGCSDKDLDKLRLDSLVNQDDDDLALNAAKVFIIDRRRIGNYFEQGASITGDVSANTFGVNHDDFSNGAICNIAKADIDKIKTVFCEYSNYSDIEAKLKSLNVLIIEGASRSGKRACALYLLCSLHEYAIKEIRPDVQNIVSFKPEPNTGYIADSILSSGTTQKYFSHIELALVCQRLKECNSHLVITVNSGDIASNEVQRRHAVQLVNSLDLAETLEKHLQWRLGIDYRFKYDLKVLQHPSTRKILDEKLLPCEIDQLSSCLANVLRGDSTIDDGLASFNRSIHDEVRNWFLENTETTVRCGFIALAVVSGCPFQSYIAAAQLLEQLVEISDHGDQASKLPKTFIEKRSERLQLMHASLFPCRSSSMHGPLNTECISFNNSSYQSEILQYVWHEYSQLREVLLHFLHSLGVSGDHVLGVKAAAAAGQICTYEIGAVLDNVVFNWCNTGDARLQKLSALTLCVPLFERSCTSQILSLIRQWCDDRRSSSLQRLAIYTLREYVLMAYPELACDQLAIFCKSEAPAIRELAASSILRIFKTGNEYPDRFFWVFKALHEHSENMKLGDQSLIPLVFCALWGMTKPFDNIAECNGQEIPCVVWFLWKDECGQLSYGESSKHYCEYFLVGLIRLCLRLGRTHRRRMLIELRGLLVLASSHDNLFWVIGNLFFTLYSREPARGRARLLYLLRDCASDESTHGPAVKILSVIQSSSNQS